MKKCKKTITVFMAAVIGTITVFSGCTKDKAVKEEKTNAEALGITTGLSADTKGEVSIMVWSGDGEYYEDIGNPNSTAGKKLADEKKIVAQNVAQVYAVAKKFHEAYPDIKLIFGQKSETRISTIRSHGNRKWKTFRQSMENIRIYGLPRMSSVILKKDWQLICQCTRMMTHTKNITKA